MFRRTLIAGLATPALVTAQGAAPLRVLGTGAVAASARDLAAAFTARSGRAVAIATANAGVAARRLRDGEAADLMLNSAAQVGRLTADGLLDGTTARELGRMLIGVAVRAGRAAARHLERGGAARGDPGRFRSSRIPTRRQGPPPARMLRASSNAWASPSRCAPARWSSPAAARRCTAVAEGRAAHGAHAGQRDHRRTWC